MNVRPTTELEKRAMEVAICAPERRHKYSTCAYIPWTVVEELRKECERLGFNWRAGHKRYRERLVEQRAERRL